MSYNVTFIFHVLHYEKNLTGLFLLIFENAFLASEAAYCENDKPSANNNRDNSSMDMFNIKENNLSEPITAGTRRNCHVRTHVVKPGCLINQPILDAC